MAYVVTVNCLGTKDRSCVEVCPVSCIMVDPQRPETKDQLRTKYDRLMASA